MLTIGEVVKRFHLSRSTLIYYDKIGLLKPSGRSQHQYRQYTDEDLKRMEKIALYKQAGLSLKDINIQLTRDHEQHDDQPLNRAPSSTELLERRLQQLNQDIHALRQQQHLIIHLLGHEALQHSRSVLSKDQWVKILQASGMDEAAMKQWHIEFERSMPEAHTDFLWSLGIEEAEIKTIKTWSAMGLKNKAKT